jgi:D-mannonate dehydratase
MVLNIEKQISLAKMAQNEVIDIVKQFIRNLQKDGITIKFAYLF